MYGKGQLNSVNEARLEKSLEKYRPKKKGVIISCVRRMDASTLPPCSRVLAEKVKRVNYICNIWCNATLANPPNLLPENCGWVLEDNAFRIKWFEGDTSPTDVEVICQDQEDEDAYSNDEDDGSEDESDGDSDDDSSCDDNDCD